MDEVAWWDIEVDYNIDAVMEDHLLKKLIKIQEQTDATILIIFSFREVDALENYISDDVVEWSFEVADVM